MQNIADIINIAVITKKQTKSVSPNTALSNIGVIYNANINPMAICRPYQILNDTSKVETTFGMPLS